MTRRVNLWREDARARGVVIGKRSNRTSGLPRTWRTRVDPFETHWPELCKWLGKDPDQTGLELFPKLRSKYPDCYTAGHLRTLQRRLKGWRREAVKRLICEMQDFTQDVGLGLVDHHGRHPVEPELLASAAPDQVCFRIIKSVGSGKRDEAKSKNPREANSKKIT